MKTFNEFLSLREDESSKGSMSFQALKDKVSKATALELNKLKNHARRMYVNGSLTIDEWKEIEKIANERYGKKD